MPTRIIKLFAVSVFSLSLLSSTAWGAETPEIEVVNSLPENDKAVWLFVQNATSGKFDGKHLTLHNVPPTFFFSDRPLKMYGHIRTADLVEQASVGQDNFRTNPPNAVLSFLDEKTPGNAMVTLYEPQLKGDDLIYPVKVISGEIPSKFKQASLFIDVFVHHVHHGHPHGHPCYHPHVGAFVAGAVVGSAVTHAASTPSTVYVAQPSTVYVPPPTTTVVVQQPNAYAQTPPSSPSTTPTTTTTHPKTSEDKLKGLQSMKEQGMITQDQYNDKAQDVLDQYNPTPASMNLQDALGGLKSLQTQGLITEQQYDHKAKDILKNY